MGTKKERRNLVPIT